jgi:hypothetical protein
MFLGWTSYRGHDYYVRQFRDMKGSVNLDAMTPSGFASYAEVCGRAYGKQVRRDYDALVVAVESGRITAARGLLAAPPRGRGLLRASRIACW